MCISVLRAFEECYSAEHTPPVYGAQKGNCPPYSRPPNSCLAHVFALHTRDTSMGRLSLFKLLPGFIFFQSQQPTVHAYLEVLVSYETFFNVKYFIAEYGSLTAVWLFIASDF